MERRRVYAYNIDTNQVGIMSLPEEDVADLSDVGLGKDFIFFFLDTDEKGRAICASDC